MRAAANRQSFSQTSNGAVALALDIPAIGGNRSSETVVTYMLNSRYRFADASMMYARIASGYRPGGPNFALPGIPPPVKSDRLISYELGLKSQALQNKMTLDLAIYRLDWKNIQLDIPLGALDYRANGGTAQSRGVEFAGPYSPISRLQIGLNAAFTDAFLTQDTPSLEGLSGDQLPNTPRWSGSVTGDYTIPVNAAWSGSFGGGTRFVGKRGSGVASSTGNIHLDAYHAIDLNAGIADKQWSLRAYAKNLSNTRAYVSAGALYDALSGAPAQIDGAVLQPRTIGFCVDYTL